MQFNKIFKSKSVLTLVLLSLVSFIYLYYSTQNRPPRLSDQSSIPTPTPADIHSDIPAISSRKNYTVKFEMSSFSENHPISLPVYIASFTPKNINDLGQSLVKYFNLNSTDNPSLFQSTDKTKSLSIDYSNQHLNYSYSPKTLPTTKNITLNSTQNSATKFISSIPFFEKLVLDSKQTQPLLLLQNDPHFETNTDSNKANYFNFLYVYLLDSYPYYPSDEIFAPLQIMIGPSNTVFKLSYMSYPFPSLTNPEPKNTLSFEESVALLQKGQGEVIYLNVLDTQYNTNTLPEVTIARYQIEYRYNPIKKMVIPYYRFTGYFLNQFSQQSPIDIILPAVEL